MICKLIACLFLFTQSLPAVDVYQSKENKELPVQILLLNDTSAWYHWGCTGTSTQLKVSIIRDLELQLSSIPIQANYSITNFPTDISGFDDEKIFESFKQSNSKLIQAIESSDAVVINGEGTLHGLKPGPTRLLYVAYISKRFFNKHVEIINHSFYPDDSATLIRDGKAYALYEKVYKVLDFIAVREDLSFSLLNQMGINATRSFDCLPLYIKENYVRKKETSNTILIAGSVVWEQNPAIIKYIEEMKKQGFNIRVLIGAKRDIAQDDLKFVAFLKEHVKGDLPIIDAKSMDEWLHVIENASLLVSGRFHHSIAAACLNTPCITLNSNTPKVSAIESDLHSLESLKYNDPDLLQKLTNQTNILLNREPVEVLDHLCDLAKNNFKGLESLSFLIAEYN